MVYRENNDNANQPSVLRDRYHWLLEFPKSFFFNSTSSACINFELVMGLIFLLGTFFCNQKLVYVKHVKEEVLLGGGVYTSNPKCPEVS